MPERLHDDPGRDALREEKRGAGVAEVMEALTWQPRRLEDPLEATGDADPIERCPEGRREHGSRWRSKTEPYLRQARSTRGRDRPFPG
jgi:hypothetical protein